MENNRKQPSENEDFTSKGRTSNSGNPGQDAAADSTDISHVDRQEGELNHGTTSADPHLFENDETKEKS